MLHLPRFLKKFIRKHTRPRAAQQALEKRGKISLLYAFLTWNLLGLLVLKILKYREAKTPPEERVSDGRYFTELLELKNTKLMRFSGFSKVGEWDLEEEKRRHGKLLNNLELAAFEKEQQFGKEPREQQQHQESDGNENEDFDVERPL